jgi:hypothetical protein
VAEVMVPTVRARMLLALLTDFEYFRNFKPVLHHGKELHATLEQLVARGGALKALRLEVGEEKALTGR